MVRAPAPLQPLPLLPEAADRVWAKSFNQIIQLNVEYKNYFVFGMGKRDDVVERHIGRWYFHNLFVNAWIDSEDVPWKGSMHHMAPPRPRRKDPTPSEFQKPEVSPAP